MTSWNNKTIVVTGATSGIGLAACKAWVRQGARLVVIGRDQQRLSSTLETLSACGDNAPRGTEADFQRMADVRRLGQELLSTTGNIDVLFLNAGAIFNRLEVTSEGVEKTFAVNHLAPFLLTQLLWERLVTSSARIVVTASAAHRYARSLDLDDVVNPNGYSAFAAYGRSKLANILFTAELARRMAGTNVTAYSFHPGVVATRFAAGAGWVGLGFNLIRPFLRSPETAAKTALYLAQSPDVVPLSGAYFADCKPAQTTRVAADPEAARRLWKTSLDLCGI